MTRHLNKKFNTAGAGLRLVVVCAFITVPFLGASAQAVGSQVFQQNCAACHSLSPGFSAAGPSLFDIAGRKAASRDFPYSDALKAKAQQGLVWSDANLKAWILSPSTIVPGTSMGFAGLRATEDADALIAFLKSNP